MSDRTRTIKEFKTNSDEGEVIRVSLMHMGMPGQRRKKGLCLTGNTVIKRGDGWETFTNMITVNYTKGVVEMPRFNKKKFDAYAPDDADVLEVAEAIAKKANLTIV